MKLFIVYGLKYFYEILANPSSLKLFKHSAKNILRKNTKTRAEIMQYLASCVKEEKLPGEHIKNANSSDSMETY